MEVAFFLLLFLVVYPYSIYPGAIFLLSRLLGLSWQQGDITPRITIIISVYNEERVIEEKIKNTLSLEYPEELLEIIVSSDGSTDRTNEIVSRIKDSRLVLQAFPHRSGKTVCLNRVVPLVKGDIVLFTDANSMFPPGVLRKITRNFNDPGVGLVSGWSKYVNRRGDEEATGIYSRIEMLTKYGESLISSCVGADGAIFAIRKELYKPLKNQDINDFVIPLNVISQGKRVILDPEIFCFEEPSLGEIKEFRRQARITNRTLRAIWTNLRFLNIRYHGWFSFFLFSHKLLKFMVPFFMVGMFLTNIVLAFVTPIYLGLLLIQFFLLSLAVANIIGITDAKVAHICKFFLITLYAQFIGWVRMFKGTGDMMWTPER